MHWTTMEQKKPLIQCEPHTTQVTMQNISTTQDMYYLHNQSAVLAANKLLYISGWMYISQS